MFSKQINFIVSRKILLIATKILKLRLANIFIFYFVFRNYFVFRYVEFTEQFLSSQGYKHLGFNHTAVGE